MPNTPIAEIIKLVREFVPDPQHFIDVTKQVRETQPIDAAFASKDGSLVIGNFARRSKKNPGVLVSRFNVKDEVGISVLVDDPGTGNLLLVVKQETKIDPGSGKKLNPVVSTRVEREVELHEAERILNEFMHAPIGKVFDPKALIQGPLADKLSALPAGVSFEPAAPLHRRFSPPGPNDLSKN